MVPTYRERSIDALITGLIRELPAILFVGPRASGKTTTASRYAASIVRLDHPSEAAAFRADPDAALRGLEEPVLLDEWQSVPEVLGAVKRAVDTDARAGRYLLTGSVRADLEAEMWPGTGRLVRIPLYGMSIAEQRGWHGHLPALDRFHGDEVLSVAPDSPDLRGYVELALRSGFPEAALSLGEDARERWLESYIDQLLTRDALKLEERDPAKLRRFFEAYALNSAGVPDEKTLYEAAGINRKTALAYEQLLINLMVVERLEPWLSNRLKRLIRSPKRYLTDASLLAAALRADVHGVLRDGDLLGRVLDTFVSAQLRTERAIARGRPRLYHLRMEDGRHEIDLIAEYGDRSVIAFEVKASAGPDRTDAKHLIWLRDQMQDRFVRGILLHTGTRVYELDDRVVAAPIAALWS